MAKYKELDPETKRSVKNILEKAISRVDKRIIKNSRRIDSPNIEIREEAREAYLESYVSLRLFKDYAESCGLETRNMEKAIRYIESEVPESKDLFC